VRSETGIDRSSPFGIPTKQDQEKILQIQKQQIDPANRNVMIGDGGNKGVDDFMKRLKLLEDLMTPGHHMNAFTSYIYDTKPSAVMSNGMPEYSVSVFDQACQHKTVPVLWRKAHKEN
jgi:hypothetical protein